MSCIFCNKSKDNYMIENEHAFAIYDLFLVNAGHALIIPKRHFKNFFDATEDEIKAIYDLLGKTKAVIDKEHHLDGYNVGVNIEEAAEQTVMHLHVHFIPRYEGH